MPREDLLLAVGNGFQTLANPPDAAYFEKRAFYVDAVGPSADPTPAFQVRRQDPVTGARVVLFTITKTGDVNFTNTTFEAGDGAQLTPSYTFSNNPTLGFFRTAADSIGIAGSIRIANQTIFYGRNA